MVKFEAVSYDWKQGGCEDEWIAAIEKFGLHVTLDPVMAGSDMYGYFITQEPLDVEKLCEIIEYMYDEDVFESVKETIKEIQEGGEEE